MNGPNPPSAHNSSQDHVSKSNHKRHHPQEPSQQQGINKRPRVRDYVGSRGSSRHLMVDLHQRSGVSPQDRPAAVMPNFPFVGLNPQQLLAHNLLLKSNSREINSFCDKPKEPSGDDLGAPLDLCMKKSSRNDHASSSTSASPSMVAPGVRLEDLSRRLSQCSDESLNSLPKKRGRKPKSLLVGVPSTSSTNQPSIPSVNDRPRKRGRPPLMSPPPNIEMSSPANRMATNSANNPVDPLALMSNPAVLANLIAQQQQLAQQWPGILGGINPLLMPNAIRDLFTHQLSGIQAQQPQQSKPSSSTPPSAAGSSRQQQMLQQPQRPLQSPVTNDTDSGEEDSTDDFKPGTNEEDIRIPMRFGWRRYTIISKMSSSGVRGDVVYISPEGKKLRTLNDVHKVSHAV